MHFSIYCLIWLIRVDNLLAYNETNPQQIDTDRGWDGTRIEHTGNLLTGMGIAMGTM